MSDTEGHAPSLAQRHSSPVRRILLAEDDREMRRLVGDALRKEGYQVLEVETGNQLFIWLAYQHLSQQPPGNTVDLVVSDIRMPGRNGIDVIAALVDAGWRMPVIFMTAFGDSPTRIRAARLGASLLDKPFRIEELTALVRASLA
jgi:DNA-binding response OmpR family regulator